MRNCHRWMGCPEHDESTSPSVQPSSLVEAGSQGGQGEWQLRPRPRTCQGSPSPAPPGLPEHLLTAVVKGPRRSPLLHPGRCGTRRGEVGDPAEVPTHSWGWGWGWERKGLPDPHREMGLGHPLKLWPGSRIRPPTAHDFCPPLGHQPGTEYFSAHIITTGTRD